MADVEKVIEELKNTKLRAYLTYANTGDEILDGAYKVIGNTVDEAIQTIRELQSKSEEVCEWKRMEDDWYSFEPTCDSDVGYKYSENMIYEWKDCPYCGRKIKVVK